MVKKSIKREFKHEAPETVRGKLTNPIGLQSTARFIK